MDVSILKTVCAYLLGGVPRAIQYLFGVLNVCFTATLMRPTKNFAPLYNTVSRVLAIANLLRWLCPTKWQSAYVKLQSALSVILYGLQQDDIDREKAAQLHDYCLESLREWEKQDDPATDIDFNSPQPEQKESK